MSGEIRTSMYRFDQPIQNKSAQINGFRPGVYRKMLFR
jgi:hypothetical protein